MKFTKEEAREKITAAFSKKVEKIDDWERTIKENVETLFSFLGEESEIELDAFVSKATTLLETQLGHINKANKNVAASFDERLKELQKQLDASKTDPNKGDKNKGGEKDDSLEKRLLALEEELRLEKTAKTLSQKKSDLIAAIEQKGVKNKDWIEAMVSKTNVTEKTDIESEADSFVSLYNKFYSKTPPNITPAGGGGNNVNEQIKNVIKQAGEFKKNGI